MRAFIKLRICIVVMAIVFCVCSVIVLAAEAGSVDFEALFSQEKNQNDGTVEGYYETVGKIFDDYPDDFVSALSQRTDEDICRFSFFLAVEHSSEFEQYGALLDDMLSKATENQREYEALFLMRMGIERFEAGNNIDPDAFENEYHHQVQKYYEENSRLFLMSVSASGERAQQDFADALVYGLDITELENLEVRLSADAVSDWATEDIATTIGILQERIKEETNPTEPPVTEPDSSMPADTEPTTGETVSDSQQTDPSEDISVKPSAGGESRPKKGRGVAAVVIAAVTIGVIAVLVIRKRNTQ